MPLKIYTELNTLNLRLYSLLSELLVALDDENQSLLAQDADKMFEIALVKKQLSEQIGVLDKQRVQLIHQTGLQNDKQGLEQLTEAASAHITNFADNWQAAAQLILQCADKNQVNGIVMENNRRSIESRISILRGQPLSKDSYTRRGKEASGPDTRSLAHV